MKFSPEDIFTPQGKLKDVEKNPNLDFLMNIFNIPRAFGVSGFGQGWNVGQHSFATALIALFWAKYNNFDDAKRDKFVTLAMLHDLHESVTGDILPMFKSGEVRTRLDSIQENILTALGTKEDDELKIDLKIADIIAFIYEIHQVSPSILQPKKKAYAKTIAEKQLHILFDYCAENKVEKKKVEKFLKLLEL